VVGGPRWTARGLCITALAAVLGLFAYIIATETFSTAGRIGISVAALVIVVAIVAIIEPRSFVGRVLVHYQRVVDELAEGLGWVAKWLVPTCVMVGFVNVLLRYIGRYANRSLTSNRYIELQWMLFGAIFLVAFPYVLKHGINVRVDFVFQRFSRKGRALIDFLGHIIGLVPYCLFAVWATWDFALTSLYQRGERWSTWEVWDVWEKSPDAGGLPRAPIKLLLLLGFVFLGIQTVSELVKLGFVLGEKEEIAAPEEFPEAPLRIE
jgi:TRAP-type mannitol/chloroaromatic compound transport system permease small subunit